MTREKFKSLHRTARLGNLGTLTVTSGDDYYWFLEQVYDLRFPHVGDNRHAVNSVRTFDTLRFNSVKRARWQRQCAYVNQITFCSTCKSHHNRFQPCYR